MTKEQLAIIKEIDKYEYVSFDLFDTLIFRTVRQPEDIFSLVEIVYNSRFAVSKIKGFKKSRIKAERNARKSGFDDITIDEIYECLDGYLTVREYLKELEISIETDSCVENPLMCEIAKWCVGRKKIIITTDMYLPRKCIQNILIKIGVIADYIYISSEKRATKARGHLYRIVLEDLNITSNQIVHIGDNLLSDIQMASKYGIKTLIRAMNKTSDYYGLKFKYNCIGVQHLEELIQARCDLSTNSSWANTIGYSVFGPVLVSFCQWIHKVKIELNIDKLLFVAREGYMIKAIYSCLYPEDETDYIRINKNVLSFLALDGDKLVTKNILNILPELKEYKMSFLVNILGVKDVDELTKFLGIYNIKYDGDVTLSRHGIENGKYEEILYRILEYVSVDIQEKRKYLRLYLNQVGVDNKKVALINNSINGNAQKLLVDFCNDEGINTTFYGVQFIKSKMCAVNLDNKVLTWFDYAKFPKCYEREFARECILFEHILFEPVGTALSLQILGQKAKIICDSLGSEIFNVEIVKEIQERIINFAKDYSSIIAIDIEPIVIKRYFKLKKNPKSDDLEILSNIYDKDVDGEKRLVENNIPFHISYLWHSKSIKSSIKWIHGYLKSAEEVPYIYTKFYDMFNLLKDYKINVFSWIYLVWFETIKSKSFKI